VHSDRNYKAKSKSKGLIFYAIIIAICTNLLLFNNANAEVNWQPGNYMRFHYYSNKDKISAFLDNKYSKGIYVHYPWKILEPEFNRYNFDELDEMIELVRQRKKYIILSIVDRCFGGCSDAQSPKYLQIDPTYNGGVEVMRRSDGSIKGSVVRLWDPAVTDRLIRLYKALGSRYNKNQWIVGVTVTEESSIGIDKNNTPGYTSANYERELKRLASELSRSMPSKIAFMGMNFIQGGETVLDRIASHLVSLGNGGIIHPDTLPGKESYSLNIKIKYSDKLAIAGCFQTQGIESNITEEDIYNYSQDVLKANFVIWNSWFYAKSGETRNNYVNNYVMPVINQYGGDIVDTVPTSFSLSIVNGDVNQLEAPILNIISTPNS
jgi:hypothetical protein